MKNIKNIPVTGIKQLNFIHITGINIKISSLPNDYCDRDENSGHVKIGTSSGSLGGRIWSEALAADIIDFPN